MTLEEMKNCKQISSFAIRCILGAYDFVENCDIKKEQLVRGLFYCADYEAVCDFLINNYPFEQFTAEVIKGSGKEWIFLRKQLGDAVFKTMSDKGGVKVGNDSFSVILSNGRGDGDTRVAVVERDTFNKGIPMFNTSVQGAFNIYDYDCGNTVSKAVVGLYGVYYYDGIVIFEKWD